MFKHIYIFIYLTEGAKKVIDNSKNNSALFKNKHDSLNR